MDWGCLLIDKTAFTKLQQANPFAVRPRMRKIKPWHNVHHNTLYTTSQSCSHYKVIKFDKE